MKSFSLLIPPLFALAASACMCLDDQGYGDGRDRGRSGDPCSHLKCAPGLICDPSSQQCITPYDPNSSPQWPSATPPSVTGGASDSHKDEGRGGPGSDAGGNGGSAEAGGAGGGGGATDAGGGSCQANTQCYGGSCCQSGTCQPHPTPVCEFNHQCGANGRCRDGACEPACTSSASCGTGQICSGGFCVTAPAGGGGCVYDQDCGADHTCINGFCHNNCTSDAACPAGGDRCQGGICKPDDSPQPGCRTSADCGASLMCVNAVCREACSNDAQCCVSGPAGSVCWMGYCLTAHEAAPACHLNTDCAGARTCIDAACE